MIKKLLFLLLFPCLAWSQTQPPALTALPGASVDEANDLWLVWDASEPLAIKLKKMTGTELRVFIDAVRLVGNQTIAGDKTFSGVLETTNTTNTIGIGTGAVQIAGGGAVEKDWFVSGDTISTNFITGVVNYSGTGGTLDIDLTFAAWWDITATGNITFTTSNRASMLSRNILIRPYGSVRTLSFPAWIFIGQVAPTTLAANKAAVISLICFGTADTDIVAAYAVQP